MPDFKELFKKHSEERNNQNAENNEVSVDNNIPNSDILDGNNLDTTTALIYANDENSKQQFVDSEKQKAFRPDEEINGVKDEQFVDQESWTPADVSNNFLSNLESNVYVGLGQVVEGFGDMAQVIGSIAPGIDMYTGNKLSRVLQEYGQSQQEDNATYLPKELKELDFSLATFTNPKFWSTYGGQFVPQLAEILASYGAAAALEKGTQKGLQFAFRELLKESAEKGAKKGILKGVTKGIYRGATKIDETLGTGKGLIGKMLREDGKLTASFANHVRAVGGGLYTNISTSLKNSAGIYNTYKDVKDENGNPLFTKEELSDIASSTFANNFSYALVDILSWGMTYGKAKTGIGSVIPKKFNPKILSSLTSKSISPILKNIAKWGKHIVKEGFEESVQESYENWSQMKAYAEVHGNLDGYQGLTKDYDTKAGLSGFYDYYTSKDSLDTRVISAAMGGLGGGLFNLKTLINKNADELHAASNRIENFKNIYEKNSKGKQWEEYHIRSKMAEIVLEDKGHQFAPFIESLYSEGKISEDEVKVYEDLFDQMANDKNKTAYSSMSQHAQKAYMTNTFKNHYFNSQIEQEVYKTEKAIEFLKETLSDDPKALKEAIAKEENTFKQRVEPLTRMVEETNQNKKNILKGQKASNVEFDVNEDGTFKRTEIKSDNTKVNKEHDVVTKSKSLFNSLVDKVKSKYSELKNRDTSKKETSTDNDTKLIDEQKKITNTSIKTEDNFANSLADENVKVEDLSDIGEGLVSVKKGNSNIVLKENDNGIVLESIEVKQEDRGKGKDKALMSEITDLADKQNKEITLKVVPKTKDISEEGLIKLYENNGFVKSENYDKDKTMTRVPNKENSTNNEVKEKETKKTNYKDIADNESEASFYEELDSIEHLKDDEDGRSKRKEDEENVEDKKELSEDDIINLTKESKRLRDRAQRLNIHASKIIKTDKNGYKKARAAASKALAKARKIDKLINSQKSNYTKVKELQEKSQMAYRKASVFFNKAKNAVGDVAADLLKKAKKFKDEADKFKKEAEEENPEFFKSLKQKKEKISKKIKDNSPKGVYSIIDKAFKRAKKIVKSSYTQYDPSANPELDHLALAQSIVVNRKLATMFPDLNVQAYAVSDMVNTIGRNDLGYTLAGAIYIDEKKWNQDDIFMHEIAHIYKDLMPDDPTTKRLLAHVFKNKALIARIEKDYEDEIEYKITGTDTKIKRKNIIAASDDSFIENPTIEKLNKIWKNSTKEERDAIINELIADGDIEIVPIEEQSVIADEVFAESLEGPLSKKYNKLFEEKEEYKRQFYVKKWWGKVKERAVKSSKQQAIADYVSELSTDDFSEFDSVHQAVMSKLKEGISGKSYSEKGRSSRRELNQQEITAKLNSISKELDNQIENHLYKGDEIIDTDVHSLGDERVEAVSKISKTISSFSQSINKMYRAKAVKNNEISSDYFDKSSLLIRLYDLAKKATGSLDFIRLIEDSSNYQLASFNIYLNKTRADKKMFLQTMHMIYKNQSVLNPIKLFIDKNNNPKLQNNLDSKDITIANAILDNMITSISEYFKSKNDNESSDLTSSAENGKTMVEVLEKIRNNKAEDNDYLTFLKAINVPGLRISNLHDNNIIVYNGKAFSLKEAINGFAKSKDLFGNNQLFEGGKLKPKVRNFIQALTATNRQFTDIFSMKNAEGNQDNIRVIDNFLTREISNMNNDAHLSKKDFIKKYARISSKFDKDSMSNGLLSFFYDNIQKGRKVTLSLFQGVENANTNKNSSLKSSNALEHSLTQFFAFNDSKSKASYLMETGRLSDSNKSFFLEVPKYDFNKEVEYKNGKFRFKNPNAQIKNAYKIYNEQNDLNISFAQFQDLIGKDINDFVDLISENKSKLNKNLLDKKGDLSTETKNKIKEYTLNQIINGISLNEVLFPSFDSHSISKRAKSASSPMFSFGEHVELENIYYTDEVENGLETTDAAFYILEEHAKMIQNTFGNDMKIGNGFKILHTGIEKDNPNFKDTNHYNKGFATILNEEYVKQNPKLKGLYNLMQSRLKKYKEMYPNSNGTNLASGVPTHFLLALPASSNKSKNLKIKNEDGTLNEVGNALKLDNIEKSNNIFDKLYYDDNGFLGLDSQNFGIQQVMDNNSDIVNSPIQFMKAIVTNAGVNNNLEKAESIQKSLVELQKENIAELEYTMSKGSFNERNKLIEEAIALDFIDERQADLLRNKMSINTPELRILAKNTLSNMIKKLGNKLSTNGVIAQQKPAFYEKSYGNTNGSKSLAGYTENFDGSLNPMEAILPKRLKGKIRTREVFTLDNQAVKGYSKTEKKLEALKRIAIKTTRRLGLNENHIKPIIDNKTNNTVGYYIKGETFIATRIPAHGPQSTGVFEAIDFDVVEGTQVQLPAEFSLRITGGDFDGDQVFIQLPSKDTKWNKVLSEIAEHWTSKEMAKEVQLPLEFEKEAKEALKAVENAYGKSTILDSNIHTSPIGRHNAFNDTLTSKSNVGPVASIHSLVSMLSAYGTKLKSDITINGQMSNEFRDSPVESRTINSANIFNIILDNASHHFADKLGINTVTAPIAVILRNLGYELSDISVLLNHPIIKEYSKLKIDNKNVFLDKKSDYNIEQKIIKNLSKNNNLNFKFEKGKDINIDLNYLESQETQNSILNLLSFVNSINGELLSINNIMNGHNKIEPNSFILKEQIQAAENVLNNSENKALIIDEKFKNNPLVSNYLKNAKLALDAQTEIDIVNTESTSKIFNDIDKNSNKYLSKSEKLFLHNNLELFHNARLLGLNNLDKSYVNSLFKGNNTIFMKMRKHINLKRKNGSLRTSLLFNNALNISTAGNELYISINPRFFNNDLVKAERKTVLEEFENLPNSLKNDLIIYDLITNNFKGKHSLFTLFDKDVKQLISDASDEFSITKELTTLEDSVNKKLTAQIFKNSENLFSETKNPLIISDKNGKAIINENFLKTDPITWSKIKKGIPVFSKFNFKVKGKNIPYIFKFNGFDEDVLSELSTINPEDKAVYIETKIVDNTEIIRANTKLDKVGIAIIADDITHEPTLFNGKDNLESSKSIIETAIKAESLNDNGRSKRKVADNYSDFDYLMDKSEYDEVMNYHPGFKESQKELSYELYLKHKYNADKEYSELISKIDDLTESELEEEYAKLASKNKFAYAKNIKAVTIRLARNAAQKQSKLTGKTFNGKDISIVDRFLMSNNIPSNHPDVQHAVRELESDFKNFHNEKKVYISKLNKATNDLFKEKFNYSLEKRNLSSFLKHLFNKLTITSEDYYKKLYGNLMLFEEKLEDGTTIKNMRYKPASQIESEYKEGKLSKAEYNFYKATMSITKELKPFSIDKKKGRTGYIPHTMPTNFETFKRRGLLGLLINSHEEEHSIKDVMLKGIDPVNGGIINATFGEFEGLYNLVNSSKSNFKLSKDFLLLKKRAIKLDRKGINEDGTNIQRSLSSIDTALNGGLINRFSNGRSIKASDFPSLDLNKAFTDYIHSTLFTNGNKNFKGFNSKLPLIDGILAATSDRNDINMNKYVKKVWKDYFLKGKKDDSLKSLDIMTAAGISSDKVIDFITKSSLVYWLGAKGLISGKGAYAIGNILAGKFQNIANAGGKKWLKGEQRFWTGRSGKFNITEPFKGIKESNEILKNLGFMDINIYDNVDLTKQNSFENMLLNFSLMPMAKSEEWIQGVHFLGMLSDEQWQHVLKGGKLPTKELLKIENEIKLSHGKGYQPTDQRMIQMYSWGRAMMQFNRYIPTMFYDKLGKEDIDIYGNKFVGSYRIVATTLQKLIQGKISLKEFKTMYDKEPELKKKYNAGLNAIGMISLLEIMNMMSPNKYTKDLISDSSMIFDVNRIYKKLTPASIRMMK